MSESVNMHHQTIITLRAFIINTFHMPNSLIKFTPDELFFLPFPLYTSFIHLPY